MSMMRLAGVRPDLAERESRTVFLENDPAVATPPPVPPGAYLFDELYCVEPGCDCRRVLIQVYSASAVLLATISHSFEPPSENQLIRKQTILDPLFQQSPWAVDLMDLFLHVLRIDPAYRSRLVRHYQAVKAAVADPAFNRPGLSRQGGLSNQRKMARARRRDKRHRQRKQR